MNSTTWYKRFADIPGIEYAGDLALRRGLPGAGSVPRVQRYEFGNKEHVSLSWTTPEGTGSASPAHEQAFRGHDGETPEQTRQRILETLELPDIPSDYLFAIQGAHDHLWRQRYERPDQYAMIEWLCWLDVRLLEVQPEVMWIGDDASGGLIGVLAFDRLLSLYMTKGFGPEAAEAAARIARLTGAGATPSDLQRHARRS